MIEYINENPLKMIVFFMLFTGGVIFIFLNLRNPKGVFFLLIFYIPLSFKSAYGSLSVYLIIMLYLLTVNYRDTDTPTDTFQLDTILIILILTATTFSVFNTKDVQLFFLDQGKIRISPGFLPVIAMFSNFALYAMVKKFITNKSDLIRAIKYMVISGTVASLAGYLQLVSPAHTFIFKHIVVSESAKWTTRIACTMQGYEMLAEYTAVLMVFSCLLFFLSRKKNRRILYSAIILNFLVIMTLTQTRGIYIAIAIAFCYLIALFFLSGNSKLGMKFSISSVIILGFLTGSILVIDQLRSDSNFVERFNQLEQIDIEKGQFASRTGTWKMGIQRIQRMSFSEKIFGAGYKYLWKGERGDKRHNWPHCLYMSYILRDGYLGLGLLLAYFAWLYKTSIIGIFRGKSMEDRELFLISVGLHLALIIFIVDEAKIEFIRHDRSQNLFWLFFGLIAAHSALVKENLSSRKCKASTIPKSKTFHNIAENNMLGTVAL